MITGGWRGPGWRVVDAHPGRCGQVRGWISAVITRHDCPVDPADAALAVSELFANAVMHGPPGGKVLVGYCLWAQGARIVVCDGGGLGGPVQRQVTSQAEGGRGLRVVDAVTARWGSFRLAGNQVTWCDLGQPLHTPGGDAWAWLRAVLSAGTRLSAPARHDAEPDSGSADGFLDDAGQPRRDPDRTACPGPVPWWRQEEPVTLAPHARPRHRERGQGDA